MVKMAMTSRHSAPVHALLGSYLIAFGAACLVVVVLTHVFESGHLLAFMGWGQKHSAGHYLDLSSAILAVTLIPAGFTLRRLGNQNSRH